MNISYRTLKLLEDTYDLCKVSNEFDIRTIADQVFCLIKESDITTFIYKQDKIEVEHGLDVSSGWKALRVEGKLDFAQAGILYAIIAPLSKAKISILVVSAFETDYLFIKEENLDQAVEVLCFAGYQII